MSFYSNTIIQLMTLLLVVANTSVVYCLMIFCRILYFNGIRLTGRKQERDMEKYLSDQPSIVYNSYLKFNTY